MKVKIQKIQKIMLQVPEFHSKLRYVLVLPAEGLPPSDRLTGFVFLGHLR